LGVAASVALLVSVVRRRAWRSREFFFVLATLFVVAVVYGCPGIAEGMHRVLPLVAHHRFRLLLTMLLAIQAACVVDRMERRPMLIGVAVAAVLLAAPFALVAIPDHARMLSAVRAVVPSVVVLALALASLRTRIFLLVAVIFEIWSVTYVWSPPLREETLYPSTPFIDALQRIKANDREPFRIAGWYSTFFPNASAIYGFEDVRVHDPMANANYLAFLNDTAGYKAWDYFAHWTNIDTPLLDYLNVRYVLIDDPRVPVDRERYELVYEGVDGRIFRNRHALPRFFPVRNVIPEFRREPFRERLLHHDDWANTALLDRLKLESPRMHDDFFAPRAKDAPLATSKIVRASNADYRIAVSAPRWSLVVSSIPWWPGWKVARNGKRVEPIRVNGLFLGFAVPPGASDVRVWYAPATFWISAWIALATLLTIGICGSVVRVRRYRRASESA
ncbi:MAG TPA: YfhO family protein, partial [Thermoanaerobaculia bacterium]|nr:YfhO family protein [Thermoanaerobaculia bacterium]